MSEANTATGQAVGWTTAFLPTIGGITQSILSNKNAQQLTAKQIEWERERAMNAHQWEMEDLRRAGLNPALTAGGQGASTSGITGVQPDYSGITTGTQGTAESINRAITAAREQKIAETVENKNEKEALLTEQKTETERENTILTRLKGATEWATARLNWLKGDESATEKEKKEAEMQKIKLEKLYIEALTDMTKESKGLTSQKTLTEIENRKKIIEEAENIRQATEMQKMQNEVFRKYGMSKAQQDYIRGWVSMINESGRTLMYCLNEAAKIFTGGALEAVKRLLQEAAKGKYRGNIEIE